jgi:hypothetical protein
MAGLRLTWDLPNRRDDGRALAPSEIAFVQVLMSADGGENFVELNRVETVTFLAINDLEPGTYDFRLIVVDKQAQPKSSAAADIEGTVPVPIFGAPLGVSNLRVTLI